MKKGIIALICMILTLVFIIVALVGPWYSMSSESDGVEGYSNFGLTSSETKGVEGEAKTTSYSDQKKDYEDENMDIPDIYGVFDTTFYITIVALIIALVSLIFILGTTFGFGNFKTMKMFGLIFSILALIFCLIAPIYFMTSFPGAMWDGSPVEYGFWDEMEFLGVKASLGPGFAWYLMIVAFITSLIAVIVIFMDKPAPKMAPPPQ